MAKGLRITVAIGTNQGIFTNVFIRLNYAAVNPDGVSATEVAALAYRDEATYDTNPADSLIISFLPRILTSAGFTVTDLNNKANVATFLYQKLQQYVETKTGAGSVVIVP